MANFVNPYDDIDEMVSGRADATGSALTGVSMNGFQNPYDEPKDYFSLSAVPQAAEEPPGMMSSALQRGWATTKGDLARTGALIAGSVGGDELEADWLRFADEMDAVAAELPKAIARVEDVKSFGDAATFAAETIVEQLPMLATLFIPGGVGAKIASKAGVAAKYGALAGAVPTDFALLAGETAGGILEQGDELEDNRALIAGTGALKTALDFVPFIALAKKMGLGNKLVESSTKVAIEKGFARRAGENVATLLATEVPTETAQEMLDIIAEDVVAEATGRGFSEEDISRLKNSAWSAAAFSLFGVPAAIVKPRTPLAPADDTPPTEEFLLEPTINPDDFIGPPQPLSVANEAMLAIAPGQAELDLADASIPPELEDFVKAERTADRISILQDGQLRELTQDEKDRAEAIRIETTIPTAQRTEAQNWLVQHVRARDRKRGVSPSLWRPDDTFAGPPRPIALPVENRAPSRAERITQAIERITSDQSHYAKKTGLLQVKWQNRVAKLEAQLAALNEPTAQTSVSPVVETQLKEPAPRVVEPVAEPVAERGGLTEREALILQRLEERERSLDGLSAAGYAQMEKLIAKRDGEKPVARERSQDQKELEQLAREINRDETTLLREGTGAGMAKERVQKVVAALEREFGIPILVVNRNELPHRLAHEGPAAKGVTVEDADGNRTLYILAENVESEADAKKTYLHEVVGHYGIRSVLTDGQLQALADELGFASQRALEEHIAKLAENPYRDMSAWKRVVEFFRHIFQKITGVKHSDREIRQILMGVENALRARVINNYSVRKTSPAIRFNKDSIEQFVTGGYTSRLLKTIPNRGMGNAARVRQLVAELKSNRPEKDVAEATLALLGDSFTWADFVHTYEQQIVPLHLKKTDRFARYGIGKLGFSLHGLVGSTAQTHIWEWPYATPYAEATSVDEEGTQYIIRDALKSHFSEESQHYFAHTRVFDNEGARHILELQSDVLNHFRNAMRKANDPSRAAKLPNARIVDRLRSLLNEISQIYASVNETYKKQSYSILANRGNLSYQEAQAGTQRIALSAVATPQELQAIANLQQSISLLLTEVERNRIVELAQSSLELFDFNPWTPPTEWTFQEFYAFRNASSDVVMDKLDEIGRVVDAESLTQLLNPVSQLERDLLARLVRQEEYLAAKEGFTKLRVATAETAAVAEGWVQDSPMSFFRENELALARVRAAYLNRHQKYYIKYTAPDGSAQMASTGDATEAIFTRLLKDITDARNYWDGAKDDWIDVVHPTAKSIYKRYKQELAKLMQSRFGAKLVEDAQGNTWWEMEVQITPKDPIVVLYREAELDGAQMAQDVNSFKSLWEVTVGKYLYTPIQMAKRFARVVPEAPKYLEHVQEWWNTKMNIVGEVEPLARAWASLSKTQGAKLGEALFEVNLKSEELGRKLNAEELQAEFKRFGLQEDAITLFNQIEKSFADTLTRLEKGLRYNAVRETLKSHEEAIRFLGEWDATRGDAAAQVALLDRYDIATVGADLNTRLAKIDAEFDALRNKNYFPHMRFGKWAITVKATKEKVYKGKTYKEGETILFETYESAKAQRARVAEIQNEFKEDSVTWGEMSEQEFAFIGLPPGFIESIEDQLDLSAKQKQELKEISIRNSPGRAFLRHLIKRRGVDGFNADAQRVYATYMLNAANHIARVEHYLDMQEQLYGMEQRSKPDTIGGDKNREGMINNYFQKHYKYIMNPGNDLAKLRSLGFMWYLGYNAKSAVVNLSQVPLVTYPYLAARHGDARATAAIARAYPEAAKLVAGKKARLSEVQLQVVEKLRDAGLLDESLATELAGFSESSTLERVVPRTELGRLWDKIAVGGAWMFRHAEKYNRYVTAIAAAGLEQSKGLDAAYLAAREAIQSTQFEYAKWNRPDFMRGKRSVFFLFWQYMQHASFLAAGGHGAGTALRFWLLLLLAAGLQGLPFAENVLDLLDLGNEKWKQLTGSKDLKSDLRLDLRQALDGFAGIEGDTWMHGLSRSFGMGPIHLLEAIGIPIPDTDVSGSLSLGRIIPGLKEMTGETRTPEEKFGRTIVEVMGPVAGMPYVLWRAMNDSNPDSWKRWERAMPTAMKSASRSLRWFERNEETMRGGASLIEFDPLDIDHRVEKIAQAFGFAPTRLNQQYELRGFQEDAKRFYLTKRQLLLEDYAYAKMTRNQEMLADVRKAIRMYNHSAPAMQLKITPETIRTSLAERKRKAALRSQGQPDARMLRPVYREIESAYGLDE